MADKINIGKVHTIDYTDTGTYIKTKLTKPDPNTNIWDLWADAFKDIKTARVCLSAGIDSQFGLQVAKRLGIQLTAVTYAGMWHDSVINSADVLAAQRYCKKHNIPLDIIDINVYDFLNSHELLDVALNYKCTSPQIAFHLKFMSTLGNSIPLLAGGEAPLLIGRRRYDASFNEIIALQKSDVIPVTAPYYIMAAKNNITLFKDLFFLDPSIYYLGLYQNVNILKTKQAAVWYDVALSDDDYDIGTSYLNRSNLMLYKAEMYKSFDVEISTPILKNTGFEDLKKHMASASGVYNEFDIQFRSPLLERLSREPWYKDHRKQTLFDKTLVDSPVFKELADEFKDVLNKSKNLTNLSLYRFDF